MYKNSVIVTKAVHKKNGIGRNFLPFISKSVYIFLILAFLASSVAAATLTCMSTHFISCRFSSEEEPKMLLWSALMRSCFSSAHYRLYSFTFGAFWGFLVHTVLLLHPWAAETVHTVGGWTGWVMSLFRNRNKSRHLLKYSKHFILFQATKINTHNIVFAFMCVTWYSFQVTPVVVAGRWEQ